MRVYEYARKRNIKSRDVVKKCHELGIMTVKNHLSLIPLKRLHELDQIDFEPAETPTIRRTIFVLSMTNKKRHPVLRQVLRPYERHKDTIYLLQPLNDLAIDKTVDQLLDVVIRNQWYKVNVYRIEKNRTIRFLVEVPEEIRLLSKERGTLDRMSVLYQVAVSLLEHLTVDRVVGINWKSGLFPLMYNKLNPTKKLDFHLYLSKINYEGIYDLNELSLFFLDFRDKEPVEYAGSLNFYKAALTSYHHIHFLDDAKHKLYDSYLRDFYYENN